jgi:hypothetical protein
LHYLRTAARLKPISKDTSFLLARTLRKLGREQEARAEFQRSRKLYQDDTLDDIVRQAVSQ